MRHSLGADQVCPYKCVFHLLVDEAVAPSKHRLVSDDGRQVGEPIENSGDVPSVRIPSKHLHSNNDNRGENGGPVSGGR